MEAEIEKQILDALLNELGIKGLFYLQFGMTMFVLLVVWYTTRYFLRREDIIRNDLKSFMGKVNDNLSAMNKHLKLLLKEHEHRHEENDKIRERINCPR